MFDYMHEAFKANRKYIEFNKIEKLEHVLGKDYDELFPPRGGNKPLLQEEQGTKREMLTKELWDEKYKKGTEKCSWGKSLAACVYPGLIDREGVVPIVA